MAIRQVPFTPYATTSFGGTFSTTASGLVAGTYFDDPETRYALATGKLAVTETLPMSGGYAISENISATTAAPGYGPTIGQATSIANLTGFSVFNNAYSWVTTPQSRVPVAQDVGATVPFFRLGSGARITVAMSPSLVSLSGGLTTQQVSWDCNNQVLQPYDAATATFALTSITSSFSGGVYTFVVVAAVATPIAGVGDYINISGVTGTGASLVNGNQVVAAFTDNQNFTFQVTAPSGSIATGALGGTKVLNYGTGALNVRILSFNVGNSMVISYNSQTGGYNWNYNGSAAIILI